MRYDWSQGSCGRTNRVMRWVLGSMAAVSWPLFAHDALRDHDWTLILPVLLITAPAIMHNVMTRKIYGTSEEPAPAEVKPAPEPRVPCDLGRPYPRPKGGRRKADSTCPVCGTGDTTGSLDGKVLGWRAHGSCAEWLGDWKPPSAEIAEPQRHLFGFPLESSWPLHIPSAGNGKTVTSGGTNTIHYTGGTAITIGGGGGGSGGTVTIESLTRKPCAACGMEFSGTPNDLAWSFGVHVESGQCAQRRRKQAAPVFPEYCTCGWSTTIGTAEENRKRLDAHHASGECPHSAKGRAAPLRDPLDLRDLQGR